MKWAGRRLRLLWRRLLRLERPRQAIVAWSQSGTALVLVACLLVALLSSWPWLVEPSVRVGEIARDTYVAPRDASVWDSSAFEERRRRMLIRSQLQVVDEAGSRRLEDDLSRRLAAVQEQLNRVVPGPVQRYDMRALRALKYVMPQALGGGVYATLRPGLHWQKAAIWLLLDLDIDPVTLQLRLSDGAAQGSA
jgi:hypothetical protein